VAEAITGKPTPSYSATRRKRREDTERGFKLARALTIKIKRSIVRFMYSRLTHDPKAERAYAEQVLREQMEEWTQEDEQEMDESFHYTRAAGFDPQP
jgi:hypothetical protein